MAAHELDKNGGAGLRQRLLANLGKLGGGTLLSAALSMAVVVINTRALSPSEFGIYVLLQSSALLLAGFVSLSTQLPVIKLGMTALERGAAQEFRRLIGMGLLTDLAAGTIATVIALGVVFLIPDLIGLQDDYWIGALIVSGALLVQGFKTPEGIFRSLDKFGLMSVLLATAGIFQLVIALTLWFFEADFIYYAVLAAITLSLTPLIQLSVALWLLKCRELTPLFFGGDVGSSPWREFTAYCASTWITGTCGSLKSYGDTVFLGMVVSTELVGAYNIAKQLCGIVNKLTVIYASVLFPELVLLGAKRSLNTAHAVLKKAVQFGLVATFALSAGAAILGRPVLSLVFGPDFVIAWPALIILAAAAGWQIVSFTYSMFVQVFVGPMALAKTYVMASSGFAIALWLGGTFFGIAGAGFASVIFGILLSASCAYVLETAKSNMGRRNES